MKSEDDNTIFRILLPNFDQFYSSSPKRTDITALVRFLKNLKTLVRATNATCLISVDINLLDKLVAANL
jgi:hypothetical protein